MIIEFEEFSFFFNLKSQLIDVGYLIKFGNETLLSVLVTSGESVLLTLL